MIFQTIIPDIEIITPIRDLKLSRQDEIGISQKAWGGNELRKGRNIPLTKESGVLLWVGKETLFFIGIPSRRSLAYSDN